MTIETRMYAGGAFARGGDPAVDDIIKSGYSTLINWALHVNGNGDLVLNDITLVTGGIYKEAPNVKLAERLAKIRKAGLQIGFSVGGYGVGDFGNIQSLMAGSVPSAGNVLYDNFAALKAAMYNAGAAIDFIDFDYEESISDVPQTLANFSHMLANIGYGSVNFCPPWQMGMWQQTYQLILSQIGRDFVSAVNLQCYSGGSGNNPDDWGKMIASVGGKALLIPGLATWKAQPGGWWNGQTHQMGGSVETTPNVAMYQGADWSNCLRVENFSSVDDALKAAGSQDTFMFYCREGMILTNGKSFQPGDAAYFSGVPWWGSAPQCDAYSLSQSPAGAQNPFNSGCPSDIEAQFKSWNTQSHPPKGGFIWFYDSLLNSLLMGQCGGTMKEPKTTAADYRKAITNGLA